jgi:hypothetical protein
MKYPVMVWAITGFVVAGGWALYAFTHVTSYGDPIMPLIMVTCPIVFIRSYPLSVYLVLAANAATYAVIGLAVETLRRQFRHAD